MKHLVFLLEEESAKEFLSNLLPRISKNATYRYIAFEGKTDLENNIEKKLRGYNVPNSYFIILRDQDSGDCYEIKKELIQKCSNAFKPDALIRIACTELESWFFGDLEGVEKALELNNLKKMKYSSKYRNPDIIVKPSYELEKITKYRYQKVSGSREIGKYINIENNSSKSFQVFVDGIKNLLGDN